MRIVVTGLASTYPLGGVFWDYLQYALGFHDLGHEVLYLEDTGQWFYNAKLQTMVESGAASVAWLRDQIDKHAPELSDRWFVRDASGTEYGLHSQKVQGFVRDAELFLNISAGSILRDEYRQAAKAVVIDSDPMYTQAPIHESQILCAGSTTSWRSSYDQFLTFGERIGKPDCLIPTVGLPWKPTRQPVTVNRLNHFQSAISDRRRTLTTVGSWEPSTQHIVVAGTKYFGKNPSLQRYIRLPRKTGFALEIAMAGDVSRVGIRREGWNIADSAVISRSAENYMRYLGSSFAEWSVAKHAYVASRSGWFSCRSACYLALGVPVIVEDTGFSEIIPTGEGLFAFSTMDSAIAAIEAVGSDYERHCRAAREIAEEYFDSRKVLTNLLDDVFSNSEDPQRPKSV